MSNTYRSMSRDHRAKVAVAVRANHRPARGESLPLGCEFSATCTKPAMTIAIRGVDPILWPQVCDDHRRQIA